MLFNSYFIDVITSVVLVVSAKYSHLYSRRCWCLILSGLLLNFIFWVLVSLCTTFVLVSVCLIVAVSSSLFVFPSPHFFLSVSIQCFTLFPSSVKFFSRFLWLVVCCGWLACQVQVGSTGVLVVACLEQWWQSNQRVFEQPSFILTFDASLQSCSLFSWLSLMSLISTYRRQLDYWHWQRRRCRSRSDFGDCIRPPATSQFSPVVLKSLDTKTSARLTARC